MHTFLKEQPQLNLHNREVQDAVLDVARFWLDRGVDGFRLDALNHAMHDLLLRDNPPAPDTGKIRTRPFDFQIKKYSQSHPDMVKFIERLRALCDEYGAIHTVAEIGGDNAEAERKAYTSGETRLNSAYGFDFLYAPELTADFAADVLDNWEHDDGWPSWAFENHDAPRAVSRWCATQDKTAYARMKMALLASLRGNIIIYQGEELGLEQDEIPFGMLKDPEAIANWPLTLSRDGARTPMPWIDETGGGFTAGEPWLPFSQANLDRAVEVQESDPDSLLAFTRQVISLRNCHAALRHGAFENCRVDGALLSFERVTQGQRLICVFNLGSREARLDYDELAGLTLLSVNGGTADTMPGHAALWLLTET